jgi:hypothetical protein
MTTVLTRRGAECVNYVNNSINCITLAPLGRRIFDCTKTGRAICMALNLKNP